VYDTVGSLCVPLLRCTRVRVSGSLMGSVLRKAALTTLKTAVLAPMPKPSDSMSRSTNVGCRRAIRSV